MKLLFLVHGAVPKHNAGAEKYLHNLGKRLVKRGHEIRVSTKPGMLGSFNGTIDGIDVQTDPDRIEEVKNVEWCDVIVSHLDRTREAIALAARHQRPLVYVVHNPWSLDTFRVRPEEVSLVVFNSRWLAGEQVAQGKWTGPYIVCEPIVDAREFEDVPRRERTLGGGDPGTVTLVNLNENKGADLFFKLAAAMPTVNFLGVRSYGAQAIPGRITPNVMIMPNQEHIQVVLAATRILLMPSRFESYGMMGLEAASCGIPIVAQPGAGLAESLGEAAIYIDRTNLQAWVAEVGRLISDPVHYRERAGLAFNRALALTSTIDGRVDEFERAVMNLVQQREKIASLWGSWVDVRGEGMVALDMAKEMEGANAGTIEEPRYSIVTFFSRQWALTKWFANFEKMALDRPRTELLAICDSNDPAFLSSLLTFLSTQRGFCRVRVYATRNHPLYDDRDVYARRDRIVELWRRVLPLVRAEILIGIEDDTIPDYDAIPHLLRTMKMQRADFVQGTAVGRWANKIVPHWTVDVDEYGQMLRVYSADRPGVNDPQVIPIQGCGWYCFVGRTDMFRAVPMRTVQQMALGPDLLFGWDAHQAGFRLFGDWSVSCEHFGPKFSLHPSQPGLEHLTWNRKGERWHIVTRQMRVIGTKTLGTAYEQTRPNWGPDNGGILVRANRTWMGDEGHIKPGDEVYVSPERHTFLSQQGWVTTLAAPPPIDHSAEEVDVDYGSGDEYAFPDFVGSAETGLDEAPAPEKELVPVSVVSKGTGPKSATKAEADRSVPIARGGLGGPNACNKCQRSFKSKGDLSKHMVESHKGGR